MSSAGLRLGIDLGTSNTVGCIRRGDGPVEPLLFDASALLASAVFAAPDGEVRTGADAARAAGTHPEGLEPNPKQRIDDGTVWLGERAFDVAELLAAILRRVAQEAARVGGEAPAETVLTYPAGWSGTRTAVLADAARRAGLGDVGLIREPVAAAAYFASVLGRLLPAGQCLVVYDFGAGTFDVSILRSTGNGVDLLAADGLADVGGNDLDAVVVELLRAATATATAAWARLEWPETAADRRARRALWLEARAAKEQLTRHASAEVHIPITELDVHVTREEFEGAARPHLDRTVALTVATLRAAGVRRDAVGGVLLVGGSSRIPLAASLLHRVLDIPPTVMEQPELVVAYGSLHAPAALLAPVSAAPVLASAPPAPATPQPVTPQPTAPQPPAPEKPVPDRPISETPIPETLSPTTPTAAEPAVRRPRRRGRLIAAAVAAVLLVTAAGVWAFETYRPDRIAADVTLDDPDGGNISNLAFSPDSKRLVTVNEAGPAYLWDLATRAHTKIDDAGSVVVAFSPKGDTFTSTGWVLTSGAGQVRSATDGHLVATLGEAGHDLAYGLAYTHDGTKLATAGAQVWLWDPATGQRVKQMQGTGYSASFSPDDVLLALGNDDKSAVYEVATGKETLGLDGHIGKAVFSPDGTMIAVVGNDKDQSARLLSATSGKPITKLTDGESYYRDIAFTPDSQYVVACSDDGDVRMWTTSGHKAVAVLTGSGTTTALAVSPDGTMIAGVAHGQIRIWHRRG